MPTYQEELDNREKLKKLAHKVLEMRHSAMTDSKELAYGVLDLLDEIDSINYHLGVTGGC